MNNLVTAEMIGVKYGQHMVLNDLSFKIEEGDYIGLVGANGSGKTTLVKAILGLVPLSTGKLTRYDFSKKNQGIGYLPQVAVTGNTLFPAEVHEVIATGLLGTKTFPKRISKTDNLAIDAILSRLDIHHLKHKRIGDLSGGQQQRVLLARAMVNQPKLLILDEPTSALDPKVRASFYELIHKINESDHTAILLVSHDLISIQQNAKKIMLLDRELVYFGPSDQFVDGHMHAASHTTTEARHAKSI